MCCLVTQGSILLGTIGHVLHFEETVTRHLMRQIQTHIIRISTVAQCVKDVR